MIHALWLVKKQWFMIIVNLIENCFLLIIIIFIKAISHIFSGLPANMPTQNVGTAREKLVLSSINPSLHEVNPSRHNQEPPVWSKLSRVTCCSVTQVSHTATEVTLDHMRTFTCWIIRSTQLVWCTSLVEQFACMGVFLFPVQGQALVIPVRTVVWFLARFAVQPRDITCTNVALYSCESTH